MPYEQLLANVAGLVHSLLEFRPKAIEAVGKGVDGEWVGQCAGGRAGGRGP